MSREMVNSGIPWIGDIPKEWKVCKVKNVFVRKNEKAHQENPIILSLARSGVKIRDISTNEGQMAESYYDYNPVEPFDLLINPMDLYSGANCSISLVSGVISPAYINLRAKDGVIPRFYDYYFKTQYWSMAFFAHGKGISFDNRWTLGIDTLFRYDVPFPSSSEQQKIASFLDKKCAEIEEMITLQEKIIEELKAYKQSVITEAVTKGLNPNVPMKESGIEWIGQIPEHWEVHRVKRIVQSFSKGEGITKEEVFVEGDISCVRYGEIYSKYNQSFIECISSTNLNIHKSPRYFECGDILCAGTGELVEEIGKSIVYLGQKRCLAGGDIIVIRHKQNPIFLNYALNSTYAQSQKSCSKSKLKVVHISASNIGNILLPIPSLAEQQFIADYLDEKCSNIDSLINIKQQKIEELKDYKKSIIYEYVTGKKEVK